MFSIFDPIWFKSIILIAIVILAGYGLMKFLGVSYSPQNPKVWKEYNNSDIEVFVFDMPKNDALDYFETKYPDYTIKDYYYDKKNNKTYIFAVKKVKK